jgi:hypothetical protein
MNSKKIITAAIVGAIMGVASLLIVEPLITKPIEKRVEETLK